MTPENALSRLREICLIFPEAEEAGGVGNPSFKVRGRIFDVEQDWDELADLIDESYRMTAPKKLLAALD